MSVNYDKINNAELFVKIPFDILDIPTKNDIIDLQNRIYELEKLLGKTQDTKTERTKKLKKATKTSGGKRTRKHGNATSAVFEEICKYPQGVVYKVIKNATGLEERQLRNIIFRLNKLNKIRTISRGRYIKM